MARDSAGMAIGGPAAGEAPSAWFPRLFTFRRLELISFTHSAIFIGLLVCAFALQNPEPLTFVLGLGHGLLWIGMSLVCIVSTRWRSLPFWLAVCVCILGGLGPFCGSFGFIYEVRRRRKLASARR